MKPYLIYSLRCANASGICRSLTRNNSSDETPGNLISNSGQTRIICRFCPTNTPQPSANTSLRSTSGHFNLLWRRFRTTLHKISISPCVEERQPPLSLFGTLLRTHPRSRNAPESRGCFAIAKSKTKLKFSATSPVGKLAGCHLPCYLVRIKH